MFRSVHIVKSADAESTGVFRIVMNLARDARQHGYELDVLFLADGPLQAVASAAGITAHVIPWNGKFQDVIGAAQSVLLAATAPRQHRTSALGRTRSASHLPVRRRTSCGTARTRPNQ